MDLQQLRYFVALSEEKHFQRAAQKTHVSQPTLSQQLKKLEIELGSPLLERTSRKIRLTPAGEKFLPYAVQVLDSAEKGREALQKDGGEITGRIRVAAIPTICPYLMPEVIPLIKKAAPKLVLELYEETTSVLLDHLKQGQIDLGVLSLPISERGIATRPLMKEKFYLAVSRKNPLASKKTVHPRDLANEKLLVLQEGHCFGSQSLEYCKTALKNPQVIFQGSGLLSVLKLAAANEGVTFAPEMALSSYKDARIHYVPFAAPEPTREIGLVWRLSMPLNRAHKLLMETVAECLKR